MNATHSSSLASSTAQVGIRPAMLYPWFASVTSLKGVGPAVAQALRRLLLARAVAEEAQPMNPTLRDVLFHLPTGIIDRRTIQPVSALINDTYVTVEVTITEHMPPPRNRPNLPYRVAAEDATGTLVLTFFHVKGDYLSRQLPIGSRRIICGTLEWYHGVATIAHPDVMAEPEKASDVIRLAPVYPLTVGLSQKTLGKICVHALAKVTPLPEWLDSSMLKTQQWGSMIEALKAQHMPQDAADIALTSLHRARLAYDELLAHQLALGLLRRVEQRQRSYAIPNRLEVTQKLVAALPFALTRGQQEVIAAITADISSGHRMVRLLQGDVGSGKTLIAFAAMAQAAAAGYQSVFMAPTDLLARQHMETLLPLAEALRMPIALLSGKMKKSERNDVQQAIAEGKISAVIGTHAVFQDEVEFHDLALMVVDEQHRFGVAQRMQLSSKGRSPHILQMTATPIPRSLTMALYGDMDISTLTERPPGRKEIDTRAIPAQRMAEVIDGLKRVIAAGEKIYWVCPLIEESDDVSSGRELAAAEERTRALAEIFPGKVGLMHGRMKLAEREEVMQGFAFGELQLLVATTVVEVGVNVPSATVMVIEHAERFGLAQLHQLRGRVGRSDKLSRCVLLYHEPLSAMATQRLKTLRETNDGFLIAEEDLKLRGAGDVLGTRQTGLPQFKLADLSVHMPLMAIARDDVSYILERDPDLLSPRGQALRVLLGLFEYDAAMMQLKTT